MSYTRAEKHTSFVYYTKVYLRQENKRNFILTIQTHTHTETFPTSFLPQQTHNSQSLAR